MTSLLAYIIHVVTRWQSLREYSDIHGSSRWAKLPDIKLTSDETMRMKGARKNGQGMITEAGNMVIYVAGYPAIMGLQPLYFRDSELARRARIPAESAQMKKLEDTLANANV